MGTVYRATSVADGPAGPAGVGRRAQGLPRAPASRTARVRAVPARGRDRDADPARARRPHVRGRRGAVDGAPVHFMVDGADRGADARGAPRGARHGPRAPAPPDRRPGARRARGDPRARDRPPRRQAGEHRHHAGPPGAPDGPRRRAAPGGRARRSREAGEFVGSLAYAAPEQFPRDEEGIGARADLYAFGVVLFELATGKNPFELDGPRRAPRAEARRGRSPPPRSVHRDVDAFWNEVIVTGDAARGRGAVRLRRGDAPRPPEGEAGEWWRPRTRGRRAPRPTAR